MFLHHLQIHAIMFYAYTVYECIYKYITHTHTYIDMKYIHTLGENFASIKLSVLALLSCE